jgi:hypothetical protein
LASRIGRLLGVGGGAFLIEVDERGALERLAALQAGKI